MNDDIRNLIEGLRRGTFENTAERIGLLTAALIEHRAGGPLLESLLRAPQVPLRLAALGACQACWDPVLGPTLLALVGDPDAAVRTGLCALLTLLPAETATAAFTRLLKDAEEPVRTAAVRATTGRRDLLDVHLGLLRSDGEWQVRHAAAMAVGETDLVAACAPLLTAMIRDDDSDVELLCASLVDRALSEHPEEAARALPSDVALLSQAEGVVRRLGDRVPVLLEFLQSRTQTQVNPAELSRFGTDLTAAAVAGALPAAYRVSGPVAVLLERFRGDRVRSLALLGKSGVGKSSLVHELVRQLALPLNGEWRVVRMSPTDFMAGTRYSGEWETKVRDLVRAVRRPRRVLLYVPNLADLSTAGRWSGSDSNVASALAPYLEDGSVTILGESTPEEFERGLGGQLALQRLFDRMLVEESSVEETRGVLEDLRAAECPGLGDDVLRAVEETSAAFLGHLARPGGAATLLRSVLASVKDAGRIPVPRDVLSVLSSSTGIPVELLDDGRPLDLAALNGFFEQRIVGQPEAVAAVVDVVTLIKSGLTDPNKPFGVLLFVGPTGVGKTELARALAEFIFGEAGRLLRFDMSEFASPDAFTRLIGGRGENGLLTDAVQQRPFSVVLLDEIEKSHLNVFDLCLQLFDAGRLTDGRGRLVDFRRSIVILTSNIGAAAPAAPLAFGRTDPPPGADRDRTFRELSRFFRPEFLNRLDRIVHFLPLSLETAERIARRELDLVLQRSGIVRRGLTLDVDPQLIGLLVKRGYSPHFGARPLKRTVETLVLLPLARAIATGHAGPRSVVHLGVRGDDVLVRMVQGAASEANHAPSAGRVAAPPPSWDRLQERLASLETAARASPERKSELVARTAEPGFYQDAARRDATFDELHRLEQFLTRRDRLREAVERLGRQASDPSRESAAAFRERVAELATEIGQLEFILAHPDAGELADAWVEITQVQARGSSLRPVESLVGAYCGLARRRNFQAAVVAERQEASAAVAVLQVAGLGALALMAGEAGLHEFHQRTRVKNARTGREQTQEDSALVRVEVFPVLPDPPAGFGARAGIRITARTEKPGHLIESAPWRVTAFHEASVTSMDLWMPGTRTEALAMATRLLHSRIGKGSGGPDAASVIRRYDLGIGSRIKDLRTGRTTTRLAQFFRGQMELTEPRG
ncbi:MAG: AAA family ATPase [Verrucomicrobia bacterium]|nr:AAA family ATPase [Verrucomicrobiota bacterium]